MMSRNAHVLCLVGNKHSPIADSNVSITGLITHKLAKDMNKCAHVTKCSSHFDLKTAHLLTTADSVKTVTFNVNSTYMAVVYLHIGLLQL